MVTNNMTAPSKYPFIISMHSTCALQGNSRFIFKQYYPTQKMFLSSSTCPLVNVSNTSAVIYDGSPQSSLFPLP